MPTSLAVLPTAVFCRSPLEMWSQLFWVLSGSYLLFVKLVNLKRGCSEQGLEGKSLPFRLQYEA